MQSLPVLVLAALAAFAPNACASSHDCTSSSYTGVQINTNILPHEIHSYIVNKLPLKDQANYLPVSSETKSIVEATRNPKFRTRLLKFINELGMHMPDETIASLFAEMIPSGRVPLGSFVRIVGPTALQANPESAKELVRLALASVQNPESLVTHGAKVSPRILLELARATGPCDEINRIFDLNAEQFKAGLGIDATWIGDFLNWFALEYLPNDPHPAIIVSHRDLSRLRCFQIYSTLDPQMLTKEFQWTVEHVYSILKRMNTIVDVFLTGKYHLSQTLLQLKPGPLEADSEKFDINAGFETCFAHAPSYFEVLENLESRLNGVKLVDDHKVYASIYYSLQMTAAVGMDAKDMWSILSSSKNLLSSSRLSPLGIAFKAMCDGTPRLGGVPGCPGSPYYQQAKDRCVLSWVTQSQLLSRLFVLKYYKSAKILLKLLKEYSLLPTHVTDTRYNNVMTLLSKISDGEELDKPGRKVRNAIFFGNTRHNED